MEFDINGAVDNNSSSETVFASNGNGARSNMVSGYDSLIERDLQMFERCFITEDILRQAKIFRVNSTAGAEKVGRKATANSDYAGIIFPYFLPEQTSPREYRLRRDNPDLEQRNGEVKEKGKYLSPPGRGNMLYFPPNSRRDLLEDTSIPIVLTEGEKKTLALYRASLHELSDSSERPHFIAIGLSGVWNFRGFIGKTDEYGGGKPIKGLITDFELINWKNRDVTILFDANVSTNNSVRAARQDLKKELTLKNARVFLADLPKFEGCNGIDDVLCKIEREQDEDNACQFLFNLLNQASQNEILTESKLKPLQAVRLSEVKSEPLNWLWEPFLALGTFSLIEGEEGIGKTYLVCALACAIASGSGLQMIPADQHIEPSNVLLISAEDSLSHVLKPRLEEMNAPCERIIAIDEGFTLDRDGILRLSMVLAEHTPKLVVIDPLFSYTGKINLNNDNEIRSVTDELKRLSEKYQCAIVGIRHIGKSKGFGDARSAGLNGVAWRASARSVLLIGKNPENERQKAICQTKTNLGKKFDKSIGFEIRDNQFFWTGESSLTAETMLSPIRSENGKEREKKQEAVAFLLEVLRDGKKLSTDILTEARQVGISVATLRRAKVDLNIKSWKDTSPDGEWFWHLPEDVQDSNEDAQINQGEHLQLNNANKTIYHNSLSEGAQATIPEHLRINNEQLQLKNNSAECSHCSAVLEYFPVENVWFCPLGCGNQTAAKDQGTPQQLAFHTLSSKEDQKNTVANIP